MQTHTIYVHMHTHTIMHTHIHTKYIYTHIYTQFISLLIYTVHAYNMYRTHICMDMDMDFTKLISGSE